VEVRSDNLPPFCILILFIESTTIQLIQRFYDPEDGQVLLDGKDIKTLNVAWLRSHIGIVSQEPVLFTGSIEENIRFGKADATDSEVQAAAIMANAHDFIMELPEVYLSLSLSPVFYPGFSFREGEFSCRGGGQAKMFLRDELS
jgi:ABC-type multidrug transport system fused ATPase/permease subunit